MRRNEIELFQLKQQNHFNTTGLIFAENDPENLYYFFNHNLSRGSAFVILKETTMAASPVLVIFKIIKHANIIRQTDCF